jgi:hypothetical protein
MTEINYKKILEEDRMELLMRYPFYGGLYANVN